MSGLRKRVQRVIGARCAALTVTEQVAAWGMSILTITGFAMIVEDLVKLIAAIAGVVASFQYGAQKGMIGIMDIVKGEKSPQTNGLIPIYLNDREIVTITKALAEYVKPLVMKDEEFSFSEAETFIRATDILGKFVAAKGM